ncbi:electron transport complex subunit RsxG [Marinomonas sp. 15G1-11]|uniref:Ion-translocating oxidoreductase complex subunit G n=1 Tax=Marinomonas phaeophyticola TaxID=3004091 RepID=A0ABT4JQX7_9GAMM|nr:electron transport complex subunit RsxG [Marinomonas sp. 15G1-11]MCZ2720645.1 electron transport complex subunit RsxG [Marinomonas sp. 15G1-11]
MDLIASIRRNSLGLGLFAVVTAGIIAITNQLTKETIANNIIEAQLAAFSEILPTDRYNNELYTDVITLSDPLLGSTEPHHAYFARMNSEVTAIIFETTAPGGYNGNLDLLVAIDKNGIVTGTRIISHKETPGLGDKVDIKKSPWVNGFVGTFLDENAEKHWQVKKDGGAFDQFTGATITPRAVVRSIKNTLTYFEQNKDSLLKR